MAAPTQQPDVLPKASRAGWRWSLAQWLEERWWKRYLRSRDPEAYMVWKRNYWLKLLADQWSVLGLDDPQFILDAGCGPAGINMALDGHRVVAIDPLLDRYRSGLSHFNQLQVEGVEYRCTGLENFEYGERFDGICCLNVINHVDDLNAALDSLWVNLKPRGWLLLGIDAHKSGLLKALFRAVPGDALHPHQHSAAEYRAMLESRGWLIEDERVYQPGRIFDYVLFRARKSN